MAIILEVTDGPATGCFKTVSENEVLTVGRSTEADMNISVDIEISGLHFELSCKNSEFRIRDLNSTNGTFLNGKSVSNEIIRDGDCLRAGQSFFSVRTDPEEAQEEKKQGQQPEKILPADDGDVGDLSGDLPPAETDEDGFLALTAREIAIPIKFDSEESLDLLQEDHSPREFLEILTGQDSPTDALKFLAYALPKRQSVWWAIVCVRFGYGVNLTPQDLFVLQEAEKWVVDPTDENRRAAMSATEVEESVTAVSWPAVAAFWSSGSLAPHDAPLVPPDDDLTGKAVCVAEMLAAVAFEPERAARKRQSFIELGVAVAQGELTWDEP